MPLEVEGHNHEGPLPKEDKMPRGNVSGIGSIFHQDAPFPRLQIQPGNTRLQVIGFPHDREQHALAVGETMGKAVADILPLSCPAWSEILALHPQPKP